MSYLIDTDVMSAYLRGRKELFARFMQYSGRLYISTVTLGELSAWVFRASSTVRLQEDFAALLADVHLIDVDRAVAEKFGEIRAKGFDKGQPTPVGDSFLAATALVHNLTLVTHNISDFSGIDDLRIEDWLAA
ncbi:type II toxin-antitoxin system VapC family toxin [Stratiformator vulcanicus]|uniref:Ribonuclease VapC n=1 Tax=Stratiformator vulcanicus TaxID=2527980 RepID=A0A517QYW2_9PLAN|nr:type II toxin-antitoxin system VapC family toxin [Stratiformator vulcanicus]QDT36821.1 tRNA(fMet)-specific endonuclease VapC [Stratiformator vulcanicus]